MKVLVEKKCTTCNGSGSNPYHNDRIGGSLTHCPICNGTGKVYVKKNI